MACDNCSSVCLGVNMFNIILGRFEAFQMSAHSVSIWIIFFFFSIYHVTYFQFGFHIFLSCRFSVLGLLSVVICWVLVSLYIGISVVRIFLVINSIEIWR